MGSGRAVGNQVECWPVPVSLLRRLGGVGSAAAVEDGADGIDVGVVGRLGEIGPEQHRQVFELERVVGLHAWVGAMAVCWCRAWCSRPRSWFRRSRASSLATAASRAA